MEYYDTEKTEKDYKIRFVDRVLDPVHGFIDLTEVEQKIIELPIFRRTQSLKQLSLANWVFPGAEHTRYIHSLGVMYVADQMARNIQTEDGKPFFTDAELQLLRLAALLHDIGHYPLSHVVEAVYKRTEECKTISQYNSATKKSIDKLSKNKKEQAFGTKKTSMLDYMKPNYNTFHHENIGSEVILHDRDIQNIIREYCPFIKEKYICDIIVGCVDNVNDYPKLSVMVQLIHSEIDADGIDYVLRDASFAGTSYGSFELGLLLRNLTVAKYYDTYILGIKPKGIAVADQFLLSKHFSYINVIYNKHVAIYDKMAEMLAEAFCKQKDLNFYPPKDLKNKINKHCEDDYYLGFTDNFFWRCIADCNSKIKEQKKDEFTKVFGKTNIRIVDNLSHYKDFKVKGDSDFTMTSNDTDAVFKQIEKTEIYQSLLKEDDESHLVLFHSRRLTNELKQSVFDDTIKEFDRDAGEDKNSTEYVTKNTKRLQEGVAVIDDADGKPVVRHLLVDDPASIMNHIGDASTYILRDYSIE